ncbi:MAG: AzlC family ABC transporter permease, partial [Clostridia bacterium]|nr:AzlC family ABC transporter permease [Clostridia bacterium]
MTNNFKSGLKDGIPIALGYLSVSFTFGILAAASGLDAPIAILISMTNMTSAGQLAGLNIMMAGGGVIELILSQLVINMRYALMSISLSQKFDSKTSRLKKSLLAFGNTDEVFAVSMSKKEDINGKYFFGLMLLPYIFWSLGTILGSLSGNILPESIISALSIALYAMFIAIIIPPA